MKVLTVIGARPQFIKAAPLSRALAAKGIEEVLLHTGQHYDANMSQDFFEELGIPEPQYRLNISGLSHGAMTGRMMEAIETILLDEQPQMVIVFGDTNSTLAGALAAKKIGIPVAHIEAGMRSNLEFQVEEINRVLSDRISNLHFVSSPSAKKNLIAEGYPEERIIESGDIMLDLFNEQAPKIGAPKIANLPARFALLTLHRQENVDDPKILKAWIEALNRLSEEIELIIPLHPRTKSKLATLDLKLKARFIEPCAHHEILGLIKASSIVISDSGGLQKEAYFCNKPCLTLREATEWVELVDAGLNKLCHPGNLMEQYKELIQQDLSYPSFYGNGQAAAIIARSIFDYLAAS